MLTTICLFSPSLLLLCLCSCFDSSLRLTGDCFAVDPTRTAAHSQQAAHYQRTHASRHTSHRWQPILLVRSGVGSVSLLFRRVMLLRV